MYIHIFIYTYILNYTIYILDITSEQKWVRAGSQSIQNTLGATGGHANAFPVAFDWPQVCLFDLLVSFVGLFEIFVFASPAY